MGKRTKTQRAGSGSPTFRVTQRGVKAIYPPMEFVQQNASMRAQVMELFTDALHSGVIAELLLEDGKRTYTIAPEGIQQGQEIQLGKSASIALGNVLPLESVAEGCPVFDLERTPGDGGSMVRGSGLYALVLAKEPRGVLIKLPSGKTITLNANCRATIGCSAGGGRIEKPFVKAGAVHHKMLARSKPYPRVRGVAMNPVAHPFGGAGHHAGKSKSTSRNAPPGRKVGAIASKRTGRKKK